MCRETGNHRNKPTLLYEKAILGEMTAIDMLILPSIPLLAYSIFYGIKMLNSTVLKLFEKK